MIRQLHKNCTIFRIDYEGISLYIQALLSYAPIAQLDRAFDYESKGRRFESCWAHPYFIDLRKIKPR